MTEIFTRTAHTWLDESGILHVAQTAGSEQELSDADENVRASIQVAAGKPRPMLIDMSKVKSISREARARYTKSDNADTVYALALLVGNPLSRMIGNFFIGMNRAPMPTRLFGSRKDAVSWLLAQPAPAAR